MTSNPFDDGEASFLVLVNDKRHHPRWRAFADIRAKSPRNGLQRAGIPVT
jgi:uncharacterized protein YbdZ (MbtH family)